MYQQMADVYDRLMSDVDYDGWMQFTEAALQKYNCRPRQILDLACGTGAMTGRLLQAGYRVIGADQSTEMLSVNANRHEDAMQGGQLLLIAQDMRKLELHAPVDAVVCYLDSFNYLTSDTDLQQTFQRIARCLKPGGLLLADMHSETKIAHVLGNETFTEVHDDLVYIWSNTYDADTRTVDMDLLFFVKQEKGLYERFEESHRQTWFSEATIKASLQKAGLPVRGFYGDKQGGPVTESTERYFFIAQREETS
ncbi:class I SAM-dependent DNA methyltransferase [Heliophilum fasciatum]|uniref:Ubiquinone/menaquinone biosynthesis C-methylase UbiE n=1 Tax=Heliophilum fasciatum TaxID=35700 RepID=A0A4R2S788_9FIRM|nr:class I SAM-dependent methyltransferase [Heliophilum fasciatum]MCW2277112.1 ubiquinone/menaquinone biosynthesis C-methylase UbiE [Heliophilum fasciatum]TCP68251.1 ubiquinone/menaquinone biosynthesis C-methylase UbiE [Heliophilum fasciatum]